MDALRQANPKPYRCRRSAASSSRRAASCAACACRAPASAAASAASRAAASWQTGNASGLRRHHRADFRHVGADMALRWQGIHFQTVSLLHLESKVSVGPTCGLDKHADATA